MLLVVALCFTAACRKPAPPAAAALYADLASCAPCHAKIWQSYRQTGMGRSFARVSPQAVPDARYQHPASGRSYEVFHRDGKVYQRRGGVEREIHYVLGSGNHSRTYLHRKPDGRIIELPLGWYAEKGGSWAMNPGFDRPDHDEFRREINFQCMFCHNGYPAIAPGADLPGTAPIFPATLPEGIDCQRCHGPGSAHVANPVAATIVNPAKLSTERQLEVCMQCHLETTSFRLPAAIVRYDRGLFSYKPGEPLSSYVLHFDQKQPDDKFEIAHAAYRLRQSACFQKSGGLVCTTCHNPHEPANAKAANDACLRCHAKPHTTERDCQSCHMPKRRTDDVVHVVMTDHFIQRRKPARDLLAPLTERRETAANAYKGEVVPYYPSAGDELYTAIAQVRQEANLPSGLPQLEALIAAKKPAQAAIHFELAEAHRKAGNSAKAITAFQDALACDPKFLPAVRGLASEFAKAGRMTEAAGTLRKAIDSGVQDAAMFNDLGLAQLAQGQTAEAAESLRRAIALNPDLPEAYANLGNLLAQQQRFAEARMQFEAAVQIDPNMAQAHNALGEMYALEGNAAKAIECFRRAVAERPGFAAAHANLGTSLLVSGRPAEAAPELEAAVRLDSQSYEAHLNLARIFAAQRNNARAAVHARKAAESEELRAEAIELLKRLTPP